MTINIENGQIRLGIKTAFAFIVGLIVATYSVCAVINSGLDKINSSVKDVRSEMHTAIDSVKNKQMQRGFETEMHFARIESKLDALKK